MIEKLKLENFRGIKEGEIELDDLTIILGANNSGKTTILEALFLAPNPLRPVPYSLSGPPASAAAILRELHRTLDTAGYAFLLHNYTAEHAAIRWDDDHLEMTVIGDSIFLSAKNAEKRFPHTLGISVEGREIKYFGKLHLYNSSEDSLISENLKILLAPQSLLLSPELTRYAYNYIRYDWPRIANTGATARIAKELSQHVHENFIDITIEPHLGGKLAIYGLLSDGRRIRLGDLGAGAQTYITAKILYEAYKPKILLYDDVEAHLNPRMLLSLASWFTQLNEQGIQIIATTHSLEAAKILSKTAEKATIQLATIQNGALKTRKLTPEQLEELADAGVDVRIAETLLL